MIEGMTKMIKRETWRPVALHGYDLVYEVSDLGKVRRVSPGQGTRMGEVKSHIGKNGYRYVTLCAGGQARKFTVHSLVCTAFHGPAPSPAHEVAHANGNRADPRLSNLRWATRKENSADRRLHGTMLEGERHPLAKLSEEDVQAIRELHASGGHSRQCIADRFGIHPAYVGALVRGEWRNHGGHSLA